MNQRDSRKLRATVSVLQLALELTLIAFFAGYAIANWAEVRLTLGSLSLSSLFACIVAYSIAHFLAVAAGANLLEFLGQPRSYRKLLSIHLRRLPAKYVPGGIWHSVGRGADLLRDGVPVRHVAELLGLEQALSIWWSGLLGFLLGSLAFDGHIRCWSLGVATAWVGLPIPLLVLMLKSSKYNRLASAVLLPKVWLCYVAGWACLAFAFTVYVSSGEMTAGSPLQIAASYLVSWMLGAIAFFAPQGMGVFEFAMGKAMSRSHPVEVEFLWFIATYRLLVLLADLLAWSAWCVWLQASRAVRNRERGAH